MMFIFSPSFLRSLNDHPFHSSPPSHCHSRFIPSFAPFHQPSPPYSVPSFRLARFNKSTRHIFTKGVDRWLDVLFSSVVGTAWKKVSSVARVLSSWQCLLFGCLVVLLPETFCFPVWRKAHSMHVYMWVFPKHGLETQDKGVTWVYGL